MKRTLAWILCVALMLMCAAPALAHENQTEHDAELKKVLFGYPEYALLGSGGEAFQAIADAAAICIDQFTQSESKRNDMVKFEGLSQKVHLSMSFKDIELSTATAGAPVTPNTHRKFTHMGWDFTEYRPKELWNRRKQLLQETVQQVLFSDSPNPVSAWFSNKLITLKGADKQCDAFCKLVYCIHILGDHEEGNRKQQLNNIEPLTRHEDPRSPSIISDLQACLPVLFVDQQDTRTYMSLMQELDVLESESQALGSIDSDEKCAANKELAEKLLDKMSEYMPILLRNEEFFAKVFL